MHFTLNDDYYGVVFLIDKSIFKFLNTKFLHQANI